MTKNQVRPFAGQDKRRDARIDSFIPVQFHLRGASSGSGRIVNLSIGGMRMVSTSDLSVGKVVTLQFVLPDGTACRMEGQIVYALADQLPRSYGVTFVSLDLKDRMKLGEFVAAMKAKSESES